MLGSTATNLKNLADVVARCPHVVGLHGENGHSNEKLVVGWGASTPKAFPEHLHVVVGEFALKGNQKPTETEVHRGGLLVP